MNVAFEYEDFEDTNKNDKAVVKSNDDLIEFLNLFYSESRQRSGIKRRP